MNNSWLGVRRGQTREHSSPLFQVFWVKTGKMHIREQIYPAAHSRKSRGAVCAPPTPPPSRRAPPPALPPPPLPLTLAKHTHTHTHTHTHNQKNQALPCLWLLHRLRAEYGLSLGSGAALQELAKLLPPTGECGWMLFV